MNPIVFELVRQAMRWVGVYLMTLGVPEDIANLTTREDTIVSIVGLMTYMVADTGWLAAKWLQFRAWVARKRGREAAAVEDAIEAHAVLETPDPSKADVAKVKRVVKKAVTP